MPKSNRNQSATRTPGQHTAKRATGRQTMGSLGRRRRGDARRGDVPERKTDGTPIIADSLFALTLKPQPGLKVHEALKGRYAHSVTNNKHSVFSDLWKCYCAMKKAITGEVISINPIKNGLEPNACFTAMMAGVRQLLPKGWDVNIEQEPQKKGRYYFAIYKEVSGFSGYHMITVKPVINALRNNKPLQDLFLQFMNLFITKIGATAWWEDEVWACIDWIEDDINQHDESCDYMDDESYQNAHAALYSYRNGAAKEMELRMQALRKTTPEQLIINLKGKRHPIAKMMIEVCKWMVDNPGCIYDFSRYRPEEEYYEEGLPFYCQASILYSDEDYFFFKLEEYLDCEANNSGFREPLLYQEIKSNSDLDFDKLNKIGEWPNNLDDVFRKMYTTLNKYE